MKQFSFNVFSLDQAYRLVYISIIAAAITPRETTEGKKMATVKLNGKTNKFEFEGRNYKMNRINDSVGGESDTYTLEGVQREGELKNVNGEVYGHWFTLKSMTDQRGDAHRHNFMFEAYFEQ